jgi:glycosyltransferase involved in cell wall biosynthesis
MPTNLRLGVVYLGTRGAGAQLTLDLLEKLQLKGITCRVLINSNNELASRYSASKITTFRGYKNKISYLLPTKHKRLFFGEFLEDLLKMKVQCVVITMHHPFNLQLITKLRKHGIKIMVVAHDIQTHPGEYWPTKNFLRKYYSQADSVICLSSFVFQKLFDGKINLFLSRLPSETKLEVSTIQPSEAYCLFVGRIKKYKGLGILLQAWTQIDQPKIKLVVAGEGRVPRQAFNLNNVLVLNKWLSHSEIHNLIAHSSFLILPYQEASQSGILKIAEAYQKACLVTPVGALPEYKNLGLPCIVAESTDKKSILEALRRAVVGDWVVADRKSSPKSIASTIHEVLLES